MLSVLTQVSHKIAISMSYLYSKLSKEIIFTITDKASNCNFFYVSHFKKPNKNLCKLNLSKGTIIEIGVLVSVVIGDTSLIYFR